MVINYKKTKVDLFSMEREIRLSKPVITSQLSADHEVFNFSQKNKLEIYDLDGLLWKLSFKHIQKQDPDNPKKILWMITLSLAAQADSEELIKNKTLDPIKDSRLLRIIDEIGHITFKIQPLVVSKPEENQAIKVAKQLLPNYLNKVKNIQLNHFKLKVIHKHIEDYYEFK